MYKLGLEKAEEPEIKLPKYVGSAKAGHLLGVFFTGRWDEAEETNRERTHAWSPQRHRDTTQSPPAIKGQGTLEICLSIVGFRDLDVTSLYSQLGDIWVKE